MKNQVHKQDPPVDPTLRVNQENKALIHSIGVNWVPRQVQIPTRGKLPIPDYVDFILPRSNKCRDMRLLYHIQEISPQLVIPQFYHEFPILVQGMGVVVLYPALKAVKKYGRVTMLQGGGFAICGLLSLITVCFLFDRGSMVSISLILISFVLIKMAYAATLGSVLWLYLAEIVKPIIYPYCVMTNWLTYTTLFTIFPIVVKVFANPGYAFGIAAAYTGYSIFIQNLAQQPLFRNIFSI